MAFPTPDSLCRAFDLLTVGIKVLICELLLVERKPSQRQESAMLVMQQSRGFFICLRG